MHWVSSPSRTVILSRHGIIAFRIEFSYSKVRPESASSAVLGSLPSELRGIQKSRSAPWGVRTARKRTGPAGACAWAMRRSHAQGEPGESGGTGEDEASAIDHDYFLLSMNAGSRTMATSSSSNEPPLSLNALWAAPEARTCDRRAEVSAHDEVTEALDQAVLEPLVLGERGRDLRRVVVGHAVQDHRRLDRLAVGVRGLQAAVAAEALEREPDRIGRASDRRRTSGRRPARPRSP